MTPLLTIFTPAYNRKHTIGRTYESLCRQTCKDFRWLIIDDGSTDGTRELVQSWIIAESLELIGENEIIGYSKEAEWLQIHYIWKENGGLYTGYNVAYQTIETELCVCIDSDDFMPDDAVEKIVRLWKEKGSDKYCGINGLDFDVRTKKPIGGYLPEGYEVGNLLTLNHSGDKKQVMRTALMREIAPQVGFEGEKDFNPCYMLMQAFDRQPMLMLNENLCWVEYQIGLDSMSQGIWKQYMRSPRSYAKYRLMEMQLKSWGYKRKFVSNIHYVASCMLYRDKKWLRNSPMKFTTCLALPLGIVLYWIIKYKNRK